MRLSENALARPGKKREPGLDIARVTAVCFVISVHFFLNNGFYSAPMKGWGMWAAVSLRWLAFTCVPLFLLITGYLKIDCVWDGKYYGGIVRILISWLTVSGISILFKIFYFHENKSPAAWAGEVMNFKAANYSWYIEMYIGIFLLCPFINMAVRALDTERKYRALLITMAALTFLPSVLDGWTVNGAVWKPVPDYWVALYPFTYYLLGGYLKKYPPRISPWLCFLAAGLGAALKGTATFLAAAGGVFSDGAGGGYSDLGVAVISLGIFWGCAGMRLSSERAKGAFALISRISLDLYLVSWVFDKLFYDLFRNWLRPAHYWWCYFAICVPVFFCSAAAGWLLYRWSGRLSAAVRKRRAEKETRFARFFLSGH